MILLDDACGGLLPILRLVYNVINILRILIPIALILLGTIDLGKAVIASEDKEIKAAQSLLIKRLVYAALIFFVPMIVYVIMNLVFAANDTTEGGASNSNSFKGCWQSITGSTPTGSEDQTKQTLTCASGQTYYADCGNGQPCCR